MKSIRIPFEEKIIQALLTEPSKPTALIILSHGAGAPMTHSFMESLSQGLVLQHLSVLRFNFPYIDQGRKSPGSPKANISAWQAVVEWACEQSDLPLILSGKSYGGRMASHLLAERTFDQVRGIVYFGFPLHAPGRDSKDRAAHLSSIRVPQLFLQGTNDALANMPMMKEVVSEFSNATLVAFENADHSFKTKGVKTEEVITRLAKEANRWVFQQIEEF